MKRLTLAGLLVSSALMAGMGYNMPTFGDFDADKNGKISQAEFENGQQKRMTQQAEAGKMMRNAGNAPTFKDIDTNHDGIVNAAEFKAHQQSCMKNNSNQKGGMGQGMGQKANQ